MFRNVVFSALSAALVGLAAPTVSAQTADASEMSADEIEALFLKQKTRGLVIAPAEPAATGGTEAVTQTAPVVEAPSTAAEAPTTIVELDKSDQINIQISFDFDSAALRADQTPKLATMCQVMQTIDVDVFRIVGHTDASGSASYNQQLSKLRAEEVKRYLVNDCGISAARLQAVGAGEQFLFDDADPNGEANRRVEFQALS